MDVTQAQRPTADLHAFRRADLLFLPAVAFMMLLFVFPLLKMGSISLGGAELSGASYARFFSIPSYVEVLVRTFLASFGVTAICLVLGYPVAMLLADVGGRLKSLLLACVILPYLTSLLVRTYAWMVILGETGPLNNALVGLGLIDRPLDILFTTNAAMIGMVHLMLPAMVLPLYSVVQGIDRAQLRAAQALGGGPVRTFLRVFLPQTLPGVAAGTTLVFTLSLGFYITPQALGSPSDLMLSNLITSVLNSALDFRFASAIALILLACTALVYAAGRYLFRKRAPRPVMGRPRRHSPWRDALAAWTSARWHRIAWREGGALPIGRFLVQVVGGLVIAFLVLPSVLVVAMSFSGESFLNFPPRTWSLRWYHAFFSDSSWLKATWLSVKIAFASTAIAMVLGATVSYALVRGARRLRPLVYGLMLAPMVVPTVVSSIGLYTTLAPLGLVNSPTGLFLAITPGSISYVVIILVATLTAFDARLEMASQSLGAGHLRTATRIILPVILPGVLAAAIFAFIHAFDEVVISSFIAGSRLQTLPLKIWFGIQYELEPVIAAVSTLMMVLPVIALPFFGARTSVLRK